MPPTARPRTTTPTHDHETSPLQDTLGLCPVCAHGGTPVMVLLRTWNGKTHQWTELDPPQTPFHREEHVCEKTLTRAGSQGERA